MNNLQPLLGTDKHNPCFTLSTPADQPDDLHVFYGLELLERVDRAKQPIPYRMLLGRLYNAQVNATKLMAAFKVGRQSLRRWGNGLKESDGDQMVAALAGVGAHTKVTALIDRFIRARFHQIYAVNHYNYNQLLRAEVAACFGVKLSAERVRQIIKQEKAAIPSSQAVAPATEAPEERAVTGLKNGTEKVPGDASENRPDSCDSAPVLRLTEDDNRKWPLLLPGPPGSTHLPYSPYLAHHAGIVLFRALFQHWSGAWPEGPAIFRQWVVAVLLGAVNQEQSKVLNSDDLTVLVGPQVKSPSGQRQALKRWATWKMTITVWQRNAHVVGLAQEEVFYYDPHTKEYTGQLKILKGWCGSKKRLTKVLHIDSIHTLHGTPVFVMHFDNFYDLRERFFMTIAEFGHVVGGQARAFTWIIDRGIYDLEVLLAIHASGDHVVTWEKNYHRDGWQPDAPTVTYQFTRPRNHAADLRVYQVSYQEQTWKRAAAFARLITRVTRPRGATVEVAILTDSPAPRDRLITGMLSRWIQENDFAYDDDHIGLLELTSRDVDTYKNIAVTLQDRQTIDAAYRRVQRQEQTVQRHLEKAIYRREEKPPRTAAAKTRLTNTIANLQQRLNGLQKERQEATKKCSRLQSLIAQQFQRLNTDRKALMDALRLTARNFFYLLMATFKPLYDNYRDDHVVLRHLTRALGFIQETPSLITIQLMPAMRFSLADRRCLGTFLDRMTTLINTAPGDPAKRLKITLLSHHHPWLTKPPSTTPPNDA